jgi:hypothetical protein
MSTVAIMLDTLAADGPLSTAAIRVRVFRGDVWECNGAIREGVGQELMRKTPAGWELTVKGEEKVMGGGIHAEVRVLSYIRGNPDETLGQIAKALTMSKHQVKQAIQRNKERVAKEGKGYKLVEESVGGILEDMKRQIAALEQLLRDK